MNPFVLLLPGLEATGALYYRQLERFAGCYDARVMPYDTDGPQTLDQFAEQVESTVASAAQAPILCGFSLGGAVALHTALRNPEAYRALVLINPATAIARTGVLPVVTSVLPLVPAPLIRIGSDLTLGLNANTKNFSAEDLNKMREVSRSVPPDGMRRRLKGLAAFDFSEEPLRNLKLPVLLIAARKDNVQPSETEVHALSRVLPNTRVKILPDSGHECLQEDNLNIAAELDDFLAAKA